MWRKRDGEVENEGMTTWPGHTTAGEVDARHTHDWNGSVAREGEVGQMRGLGRTNNNMQS